MTVDDVQGDSQLLFHEVVVVVVVEMVVIVVLLVLMLIEVISTMIVLLQQLLFVDCDCDHSMCLIVWLSQVSFAYSCVSLTKWRANSSFCWVPTDTFQFNLITG